jgi:uncharacterized protein
MLIDLKDVLSHAGKELDTSVPVELTVFESRNGSFPITESTPFQLHVNNVEDNTLHITGDGDYTVSIPCDRCLEPVAYSFSIRVEEEFPIENGQVAVQEEEPVDYMIGSNLNVDKLIYEEILVRWPAKVLCKEDCRGICKKCGANLNIAPCDCEQTEPDPRMAAIQDIFNKFKEV